jgi:amidohydrolase
MNSTGLKQQVVERVDALQNDLWEVVSELYANPEVAFEEYQSSELLSRFLEKHGFEVKQEVGILETAFQATLNGRKDWPVVAFLAEYDALPGIGHACGHNLIAAAALGAGIGTASILDQLSGQIRVIGTPAEEGGGGKRIMVDAGVFEDVDTAMMFHPASRNMVFRGSLASMRVRLEFFGKTAHAAASPQEGVNALDAMILTFNNINALRQHMDLKDRIAGIITHGGDAANIIPGYTSAEFSVRGEHEDRREEVLEKLISCAEAAALATGCEMKYEALPGYTEIVPNRIIGELFSENMTKLGRDVIMPGPNEPMGSTDMGNVSKVVPSIHAYLATVNSDIAGHTVEFREVCMSDQGRSAMLDAAKAMAMTAVDLFTNPQFVQKARSELDNYLQN